MALPTRFRLWLTGAVHLAALTTADVAWAAPPKLGFVGLSSGNTIADVMKKFPSAKRERWENCLVGQKSLQFADGVSSCDYATLESYSLGGYDYHVAFFFFENSGLKEVSLRLEAPQGSADKSDRFLQNAYLALLDMYVSKYGTRVSDSPCETLGKLCAEWQMDGTSKWHAGGERIEMKYNSGRFPDVGISYTFANIRDFDKF